MWSKYQEAIFATNTDKESICVEAVAGSGKTTTGVELTKRTKACRALAIAFSKRIAVELEQRMPRHFECRTFNGLGHRGWANALHKKLQLSDSKLFQCAKDISVPPEQMSEVMELCKKARINGIVHRDFSDRARVIIHPDTQESWEEVADVYDLEFDADILVYARELLRRVTKDAFDGRIDFDDQIYMPVIFGAPLGIYDMILIDEVQDLSLLQHEFISMLTHVKTRIVAFGDSRQAIYAFRGAHSNSMQLFRERFALRSLPLTISYRCPKAIVKEAQQYVSHIEASPTAPEGSVTHLPSISVENLQPDSAILCRNTAPLVETAWKLIRAGIPVHFLGKQLGKGLVAMVKKMAKSSLPIDTFLHNLSVYTEREIKKHPRREETIRDKADTLITLAHGCGTSADLIRKIEKIFEATSGRITLATIHTSKGFEWPIVYLLDWFLIPSEYATQEWQLQQEDNLAYVAITRCQRDLIYINSRNIIGE